MKKLLAILGVFFDAFAESHGGQVAVNDSDKDAAERDVLHRAAVGDSTVAPKNPLQWDAFKPKGA